MLNADYIFANLWSSLWPVVKSSRQQMYASCILGEIQFFNAWILFMHYKHLNFQFSAEEKKILSWSQGKCPDRSLHPYRNIDWRTRAPEEPSGYYCVTWAVVDNAVKTFCLRILAAQQHESRTKQNRLQNYLWL